MEGGGTQLFFYIFHLYAPLWMYKQNFSFLASPEDNIRVRGDHGWRRVTGVGKNDNRANSVQLELELGLSLAAFKMKNVKILTVDF